MKKLWFAVAAVAALAVVMLAAFFAGGMFNQSTQATNWRVDLQALDTKQANYVSTPPTYPDNSYKTTKIFLENATLWYDYLNASTADGEVTVSEGSSLFIVNGTIRNDYSTQEIIELSHEGVSTCRVALDIYLYDGQGNLVNTVNSGNPLHGCFEVNLLGDEEANFDVAFAASTQNVAYFEIYVSSLYPIPLF